MRISHKVSSRREVHGLRSAVCGVVASLRVFVLSPERVGNGESRRSRSFHFRTQLKTCGS
ncbi:unnamed protein product [Scytosiphon promiscuus]